MKPTTAVISITEPKQQTGPKFCQCTLIRFITIARRASLTLLLSGLLAQAERLEVDLSGPGWRLWQDQAAHWQEAELFLPPTELGNSPSHPSSGGWDTLAVGTAVSLPGTTRH